MSGTVANPIGITNPPIDELLAATDSKYSLVIYAAKRARQVRAVMPGAKLVFLAPPSWDELVRRLTGRGTEDAAVVEKRLAVARDELAAEPEFDVTLVNTSVPEVVGQLVALAVAPAADLAGRSEDAH